MRSKVLKVTGFAVAFVGGTIFGSTIHNKGSALHPVDAALPIDRNRPAAIMKFGFPASQSSTRVRKNYILAYDNRLRNATWVFEHLSKDLLSVNNSSRENSIFTEDLSIHGFFRARNKDYYKSGYDRGHIAAASNHRTHQEWMDETFYLTNILPQDPILNRNVWNKLEKSVRRLTNHFENVYVCTGPLYLPKTDQNTGKMHVSYQVIGPNQIAVPTHFFKVVVCEKGSSLELLSYIIPNEPLDPHTPLDKFLHPIEAIERAAGIVLLDKVSKSAFVKINQKRHKH